MDISNKEFEIEKEYLDKVYRLIKKQLDERTGKFNKKKEEVMEIKKYIWTHNMDSAETSYFVNELFVQEGVENFLRTTTLALERMKKSAYFGRLDFKENKDDKADKFYIGISNLLNRKDMTVYVYDWRTPFASMYYDYEIGEAEYNTPDGIIKGDINKKIQYKIEEDEIKYIFNSSIKIEDEILQQALNENTDEKMKNIVTTIQKEQNKIIRNEENEVLVVQGPAGSGKTSVALHRIAYLMYKHGKEMKFNNILIFSPNEVFMDYISNVLPEMGEQNVLQTTFNEYAISFLKDEFKYIESLNEQLEFIYDEKNKLSHRGKNISFKMSNDMLDVLNNYILYIEKELIEMKDLYIKRKSDKSRYVKLDENVLIMSKDEMEELYTKDYKNMPILLRINKIIERAVALYDDGSLKKSQKNKIRNKLRKEFIDLDALKLYKNLYKDFKLFEKLCPNMSLKQMSEISEYTLNALHKKEILYEDIAPLLYLQGMIEGFYKNEMVKHVVIDEAQDYSIVQYEIIKNVFRNSKMTILGDINQSIHPHVNYKNYDDLKNLFNRNNSGLMRLSKSFRSSSEITTLSRNILKDDTILAIKRYRGKPQVIYVDNDNVLEDELVKKVSQMKKDEINSIGIICKSSGEAKKVYDSLKEKIDVDLVSFNDLKFKHKVIILPSYLAKGLEFDGVILHDVSENIYKDADAKLFYTMCTRPLHKLVMFSKGKINKYLKNVDNKLYEYIKCE